jgi:hypothetical protein
VLAPEAGASGDVRGTLRDARLLGAVTALRVDVPDRAGGTATVQALRMGPVALAVGDEVVVQLDPALALVFPISR